MKRQRAPLGELCDLIKGTSPISKTSPGPYPLVTTGKEHKTADTFQFDTEAVCIPLISSTGHGHASLKRVHYQTGKFALANLLAAALVKKRSLLLPRFLAWYLTFTKDRLIVPLMTGAANMSISIDRLATVPVECPSLEEQKRIVNLLDKVAELRNLRVEAENRTTALAPALFARMFGDPDSNPKGWPKKRVREVVRLINGRAFKPAEWGKIGFPIIRIQNLKDSEAPFNFFDGDYEAKHFTKKGALLISWAGQLVSFGVHVWDGPEGVLNQHIFQAEPLLEAESHFLQHALTHVVERAKSRFHGIEMKHLTKGTLEEAEILLPPVPLQEEFAIRVTEVRELEDKQAASRRHLEDLFQSLLHRAFRGEL